jgi:hypothetical protein
VARPRKPPTEHALNPYQYSVVALDLACEHVGRVRRANYRRKRPAWVWADLLSDLFWIAFERMMMFCRRYDGRGTPDGFLRHYLPMHCRKAFDVATERALNESGHLSYEEVFADLP